MECLLPAIYGRVVGCTRQIPATKIWVPLTRAQAFEACEWHIERCSDATDKRETWTGIRDTFGAEPNGMAFALHASQCRAIDRAESGAA